MSYWYKQYLYFQTLALMKAVEICRNMSAEWKAKGQRMKKKKPKTTPNQCVLIQSHIETLVYPTNHVLIDSHPASEKLKYP